MKSKEQHYSQPSARKPFHTSTTLTHPHTARSHRTHARTHVPTIANDNTVEREEISNVCKIALSAARRSTAASHTIAKHTAFFGRSHEGPLIIRRCSSLAASPHPIVICLGDFLIFFSLSSVVLHSLVLFVCLFVSAVGRSAQPTTETGQHKRHKEKKERETTHQHTTQQSTYSNTHTHTSIYTSHKVRIHSSQILSIRVCVCPCVSLCVVVSSRSLCVGDSIPLRPRR